MPGAPGADSSAKASSIALRVRVSLDGSRCVYVRRVKPGSEWPRYSELETTASALHRYLSGGPQVSLDGWK